MANIEMYDYLTTVVPDNNVTLSVTPRDILIEEVMRNQVIHLADDESEEVMSLSDVNIFHVILTWTTMTESDSGTIIDFWLSDSKGNGMAESFKWSHPVDGHIYVVKYRSNPFSRRIHSSPDNYDISNVRLKIMGRILD